jgi:hypothetical protein
MKAYSTSKGEKVSREKILEHIEKVNSEQVGACPFAAEEDILYVKILCQLLYDELERVARCVDQFQPQSKPSHALHAISDLSGQLSAEKPRSLQDFTFNQDKEKYLQNKIKMLEAEVDTLKTQVSRKNLLLEKQTIKKSLADKDWQKLLDLVSDATGFIQEVTTFVDTTQMEAKLRSKPNSFMEKKGELLSKTALQLSRRFDAVQGFLHSSKREPDSEESQVHLFESPDIKRFFLSSKKSTGTPTKKQSQQSPSDNFSKTQPINLRMSKGSSYNMDLHPSGKLPVNYDALPTDSNLYKLSPDASNYIEEEKDRLELGRLIMKYRPPQLSHKRKQAVEGSLEANACSLIEKLVEEKNAAIEMKESLSKVDSFYGRNRKRSRRA